VVVKCLFPHKSAPLIYTFPKGPPSGDFYSLFHRHTFPFPGGLCYNNPIDAKKTEKCGPKGDGLLAGWGSTHGFRISVIHTVAVEQLGGIAMHTSFMQADKLNFDPRPQMGAIFADGFGHLLKFFSRDTKRLAKAFAHTFDLQCFYVAVQGDTILAMTACTNGVSPVTFDKAICRKELGFFRGGLAHVMLTKYIANHKFPFDFAADMGRIEIVATAAAFRGKGIAHGLIKHIMQATPYTHYVLVVVEGNTPAIKLYEKLGLKVIKKVEMPPIIKQASKINSFLYMKS